MRTNRKVEFTDRRVERLQGPEQEDRGKAVEFTDTRVPRLKLSVSTTGLRTWSYRYLFNEIKRVDRIGTFPGIKTDDARRIALAWGASIDQGIDPRAEKVIRKEMPTVEAFAYQHYEPFAKVHKKSYADDAAKLRMYIIPKFGKRRMSDVTRHDIDLYRTEIAEKLSPSSANRHHALLSRMFSLGMQWDIVKTNPCIGLKKFKERTDAGRFLSPEDIGSLLDALDQDYNVIASGALKVLLFSGLRREEVAQARWEHLDIERGLLFLPTTKAQKSRWVPLNNLALEVITNLPKSDSPWIFPGRDVMKPINNLRKPFNRALEIAKLGRMRVHDCRVVFASSAAGAGVSLFQIQSLLGHSSPVMTMRYSFLAGRALHDASTIAANAMISARTPSQPPAA